MRCETQQKENKMRGTDKQVAWATDIKAKFFTVLETLLQGDPRSNPALSAALDKVEAAPASWWIELVKNNHF